jgi:hypothetical protein
VSDAESLVVRFLRALEARDLYGASGCLAFDVQMVFPGGAVFSNLDQLIDWARPRYQRVAKKIERIDTSIVADGEIAICQGTLYGVWPDGKIFQDIRFVDWFLIRDGLICRQHVWNDLAETSGKA